MSNDILYLNESFYDSQIEKNEDLVESWVTMDNNNYFFSYKSIDTLPSGLYSITFSDGQGYGLSKTHYDYDAFISLPSSQHKNIVNDLKNYWDNLHQFKKYNIIPKRGVILHGAPGCGKTTLIYLLIEEINKLNGISIYFNEPESWVGVSKLIRKIEPNRPILCIIEDLDLIIDKYGEDIFLNFLDGVNSIPNIVYLATTNDIDRIPDRIKNRPSRFDKKYEIKKPTDDDRRYYFEKNLVGDDITKYDIETLVKDTASFSFAHLKEVLISLYILNNNYEETILFLKGTVKKNTKISGFSPLQK